MWRGCALSGTLAHAVVGIWWLAEAVVHSTPATWLAAGLHALVPATLGFAAALAAGVLRQPPEVLTIELDEGQSRI